MLFLTFSVLVANPRELRLHGGQSRSTSPPYSARKEEKGKEKGKHI